jgi:predicted transglutaminase-like cysteine proteinase
MKLLPYLLIYQLAIIGAPTMTHSFASGASESPDTTARLSLPVIAVEQRIGPYSRFCGRMPEACRLHGTEVLEYSAGLMNDLLEISAAVNREIRFALDRDIYGTEDFWSLPVSGHGDCEDMALEKRRRLSAHDYSTASLRLAIVFHNKHMTSHCVLTVETSAGTFLLDSQTDQVLLWNRSPYYFESRERSDGRWERFDQSSWWAEQ